MLCFEFCNKELHGLKLKTFSDDFFRNGGSTAGLCAQNLVYLNYSKAYKENIKINRKPPHHTPVVATPTNLLNEVAKLGCVP
jgi:hypothetical protein